jgi:bacteriorhodopsin
MILRAKPTDSIYFTFFAAYIALAGTTVITFLGALGNDFTEDTLNLKYSLVSETCVNIIAGLTYSYIMRLLDDKGLPLNKVTPIRYIDWALTTPLLILSFVLYVHHYDNKQRREEDTQYVNSQPDYKPLGYIIPLNFLMLMFGYLGETRKMESRKALLFGFAAYTALFFSLYNSYIRNNKDNSMHSLFVIFTLVWGVYGGAYLLDTEYKNIVYNILDVASKAGFGILIWISTFSENV